MQTELELEQAVELIEQEIRPITDTEMVHIEMCRERVLARDFCAPFDNPPFDKSPLDGFALRSADTAGAGNDSPVCILVKNRVCAGMESEDELRPGEAVRIMTGAPMPKGADCVVRLEDIHQESDQSILIYKPLKKWENYCFQGEDIRQGTILLEAGAKLGYVEQGILASMGIGEAEVARRPRVALLVTGDELIDPGRARTPGKIYDSNRVLLKARLKELGMDVIEAGQETDDVHRVAARLEHMACRADFILTTGGVSMGDKDIFHEVLPLMQAQVRFWKVRLKPGTPALFSVYRTTPMLHLSGNPFAAATTFELLARPALAKLGNTPSLLLARRQAVLENSFPKESKGRRMIRGNYHNGRVSVPLASRHASGILSSMRNCNCLVDIPAGSPPLQSGHQVSVLLLNHD